MKLQHFKLKLNFLIITQEVKTLKCELNLKEYIS